MKMWPLERTQAKKVDDTRRTTDDGHSTITIAHSCSGEPKKGTWPVQDNAF